MTNLASTADFDTAVHRAPRHHLAELDDQELLRRSRLHDSAAFQTLLTRHGSSIHRFLLHMLRNPTDADEASQETFIAAWKGIDRFRGDSSVQTWLFTIASRKAADLRKRRVPIPVDSHSTEMISPLETHHSSEYRDLVTALREALATLPARQREVWVLREIQEMSYREIADVIHQNTATVRGLLARARASLAQKMEEWR